MIDGADRSRPGGFDAGDYGASDLADNLDYFFKVVVIQLERLHELMVTEPARAKMEIVKHLDGALTITPKLLASGEHRAEIRGRAKLNGLLAAQGAVCTEVVARAGKLLLEKPRLERVEDGM